MTEGVKRPVKCGVAKYPSMTVAAQKRGINYNTFYARLRKGMTEAQALQMKVRPKAAPGTGPKAKAKLLEAAE